MEEASRPDKSLQSSLLITVIFLMVLVVLGMALHPGDDAPEGSAGLPSLAQASSLVPPGGAPIVPIQVSREPQENLLALTNCLFTPMADNDADSFWVATDHGAARFKLYYVDAPDIGQNAPGDTEAIMDYFTGLTEEDTRKLARDGQKLVSEMLMARPFDVVTRWEKAVEESTVDVTTYRAFVMLRDEQMKLVNLSTYLVANGLAKIEHSCEQMLPSNKTPAEYFKQLESFKQKSQIGKLGGWSRPTPPRAVPVPESAAVSNPSAQPVSGTRRE
jgi:hypothetical protein